MEPDWVGEYANVEAAFARPTLSLLHKQWAIPVLTVFRTAFANERQAVPASQFRARVSVALAELGGSGKAVPQQGVPDLCRTWVADGWLRAEIDSDLGEVYRLTASSVEALTFAANLAKHRLVSTSRVSAILDAISEAAQVAAASREDRLVRLNEQIEQTVIERDRLLAAGELEPATVDEMIPRYNYIAGLLSSLPADFRRVADDVAAARQRYVSRAIAGDDPAGTMLSDALDDLSTVRSTRAGRSFDGVVELLGDDAVMNSLRRDIEAIMAHEFSAALDARERRTFADFASLFTAHVSGVLEEHRRFTRAMGAQLRRLAANRDNDQAIASALRAAKAALRHSAYRYVDGIPSIPRTQIVGVHRQLYDPDAAPPPAPLTAAPDLSALAGTTLEHLRMWGGPSMSQLRDHLDLVLAVAENPVTLAQVWDESAESLRRPVEIIGYLTTNNCPMGCRLPAMSTTMPSR